MVRKIKSNVAIRISEFLIEVKDVFPKNNVCVRIALVLCNKLQSRLFTVLRRVHLPLMYKRQWRKKWVLNTVSWLHWHKGLMESWKLCLNLCCLKWFKLSQCRLINLIPLSLWQLYAELAVTHRTTQARVQFTLVRDSNWKERVLKKGYVLLRGWGRCVESSKLARVLLELKKKVCRLPVFENFTRKTKPSVPTWKPKEFQTQFLIISLWIYP